MSIYNSVFLLWWCASKRYEIQIVLFFIVFIRFGLQYVKVLEISGQSDDMWLDGCGGIGGSWFGNG